ncbi:MAG TPA: phosphatidylserine decarboxylase, partial [Thermoanaerobaculia bacterium]|nr:phosphatidylserine decarboxylase [Thermoanaerobaculia bacterium]
LIGSGRFLRHFRIPWAECLEPAEALRTPRQIFERKIRYWSCRPLPADLSAVVSPADSRVMVGSLEDGSLLEIKHKLFELPELLGERGPWVEAFSRGDFAIFRLTPEQYHWNHTPVAGRVLARYEVAGSCHSCHPVATLEAPSLLSKNRRTVTVFDTDVDGGSGVGRVAMVEVVALLIGEVVQAYSTVRYDDPRPLEAGQLAFRGRPKSLFRPGSSTVVLLFEPGRIQFAPDLEANRLRTDVESVFSRGGGRPVVETAIQVRSLLATRRES